MGSNGEKVTATKRSERTREQATGETGDKERGRVKPGTELSECCLYVQYGYERTSNERLAGRSW